MNVADSSTAFHWIFQEDHAGLPGATVSRHLINDNWGSVASGVGKYRKGTEVWPVTLGSTARALKCGQWRWEVPQGHWSVASGVGKYRKGTEVWPVALGSTARALKCGQWRWEVPQRHWSVASDAGKYRKDTEVWPVTLGSTTRALSTTIITVIENHNLKLVT